MAARRLMRDVGRLALSIVVGCLTVSCSPHTRVSTTASPAAFVRARTHSSAPTASDPHLAAVAFIQSQPLYKRAQASCQRHEYREAARLLQQLAAQSGLSSDAAAFVRDQRALCLRDAGLPVPRLSHHAQPVIATASHTTPADADCGPHALLLVCQRLNVPATLPRLRQLAGTTAKGTSLAGLQAAAKALGLNAEGVQVSRAGLAPIDSPAIAFVNGHHFIAVLGLQGEDDQATATIHDPNDAHEQTILREHLLQLCGGYLLLLRR